MTPSSLQRDGFALISGVLDAATCDAFLESIRDLHAEKTARPGIRNLLRDYPEARDIAASSVVRTLVEPILGAGAFAVRGILFDKTPDANWKVVWHQDLSLAVRERKPATDWGPWSEKEGVPHVQPPAAFLERMLTVRLHLDPCGPENGPLRVLPGTHILGRLSVADTAFQRECVSEIPCLAGRGDALLMRPLLLHASSAADTPAHRRVLHLEYAAEPLPFGLEWYDCVPGKAALL